ncbi:hypothetical protein SAMN05192559_107215 [Halobacillus karajensis]|uniref:hypothetical protein n=1 Tax=Halobacillus karajensis TaxID=195088 RepID=UPI0008A75251|nr:hypothetical protein [Halobacillus karajensis]SEI02574.1 hypothetical protein SAMN05192559_107215 [Halobacillus karajensis]
MPDGETIELQRVVLRKEGWVVIKLQQNNEEVCKEILPFSFTEQFFYAHLKEPELSVKSRALAVYRWFIIKNLAVKSV